MTRKLLKQRENSTKQSTFIIYFNQLLLIRALFFSEVLIIEMFFTLHTRTRPSNYSVLCIKTIAAKKIISSDLWPLPSSK